MVVELTVVAALVVELRELAELIVEGTGVTVLTDQLK